jgi:hypothetical protein
MSLLGKFLYSTLALFTHLHFPAQRVKLTLLPPPVTILLLNAICIPSEDRFLARGTSCAPLPPFSPNSSTTPASSVRRGNGEIVTERATAGQRNKRERAREELTVHTVGLAPATFQRGFGQEADSSVRYKVIQLIASVRTVMRGRSSSPG